jgi:hypothetical protein
VKFYVAHKVKRPGKRKKVPGHVSLHVVSKRQQHTIQLPTDVVSVEGLKHNDAQVGRIAFIYNEYSQKAQGTAAALVEEPVTKERFLLTAGHVTARNMEVAPAILGERVLDENGNVVGTLAYAPDLASTPVDAALVRLSISSVSNLLRRIDDQPVTEVCPLQEVRTGASYTMLSWVKQRLLIYHGVSFDFPYPYKVGAVIFPIILHFDCSATGGDSGSLVVDDRNRAVGMHVLGIEGSDSFCLPIGDVLRQCTPGDPLMIIT